jgi:ribosomal protein L1
MNTHTIRMPIAESMLKEYNKLMSLKLHESYDWEDMATRLEFDKTYILAEFAMKLVLNRPDWNANLSFKTYQRLGKEGIMPTPKQVTKPLRGAWMTSHA